jgi:hypothetical protein
MLDLTQVPAPRVPLVDGRTGLVSTEWFRFFNGLYSVVGANQNVIQPANGGTGLSTIPTNGQLLIGNGAGYTLDTLTPGAGIGVTNTSGAIAIGIAGGVLGTATGGTGQSTYTNGQLLIGNTTGNTLSKATLTAGAGVTITNGPGSVTIASPKAYGRFAGLSTQSAAAIATAYKVDFDATYLGNGVTMVGLTDATVTATGIYNFQYSLQFLKATAGPGEYYFWVRVNGANVVVSARGVTVTNNGIYAIGVGNIILSLNAGDYFTLMWSVSDVGCQLVAVAGTPDLPSATLTVQQV